MKDDRYGYGHGRIIAKDTRTKEEIRAAIKSRGGMEDWKGAEISARERAEAVEAQAKLESLSLEAQELELLVTRGPS